MGTIRRAGGAGLALAMALFIFGGAPAAAADPIVADPECCTFVPGPYVQDLGEVPDFNNPSNADAPHNVTARKNGPDGKPLFRSASITAGSQVPVKGTQYLGAGTYEFFCTIHGPSMSGQLKVEGGKGTVVARPKIKVKIPSQPLKKVRKSGKLKVKLKAVTESSGIALKAKKGSRLLAKKSGLKLAAGKSRTVKLKLTKSGRKAVKKGKKVKVSAKGTVAFGKPASAKRKLR